MFSGITRVLGLEVLNLRLCNRVEQRRFSYDNYVKINNVILEGGDLLCKYRGVKVPVTQADFLNLCRKCIQIDLSYVRTAVLTREVYQAPIHRYAPFLALNG
jgi:hypothetical protein